MKTPVSKPVLAIVVLGLALSAFVVWFGLHSRKPAAPETAPVVAKNSDTPAVPRFLSAPATKKIPAAPAAVAVDNSLLPVIPISLVKLLSADAAYTGSAMGSLPSGTQKFGGVEFWLQGIIRLQGTGTRDFESSHFRTNVVVLLDETNEVNGQLVVNERGKNISTAYLVGGSLYSSDKSHEKIADLIWHYDDDTRSSPLEANLHLRDWVRQTYEEPARLPNPLTKVAWHGPHPSRKDVTLRLYRVGFVNPHPEKIIRSLEFVGAMKKPSLFIAALTLDPLMPGARPDNLTSEEFADPELGGLLQLFVQDADGHAIPGADVRSGFNAWNKGSPARHATTDAAGMASVHFDPAADTLEVNAEADGFSGRMMLWSMKDGDKVPANYTLKLSSEMKFGGLVVNEENVPVSGASVTASRFWRGPIENGKGEQASFSRQVLTTDTDGRWQVKGVSPTLLDNLGFSISHPDYVGANAVNGISGTVEQQLRAGTYKTILRRGQVVRGRVLDGQEQPVVGASVQAGRKYDSDRRETKTDAEGRFKLSGVKTEEVIFSATAKGFSADAKNVLVQPDMAEIIFHLKTGIVIRAHVQDESAQPVAGAQVSLQGRYDDPVYAANNFSATTDANGDFSWDSAPDRTLTFYIGKTGFESKNDVKLKPNEDNLVTLRRGRKVEGVVLDATTGQPVTNFIVRVGTSNGDGNNIYGSLQDKKFSPPDGRFSVDTGNESENAVLVSAEDYADKVEKFSEGKDGTVTLTVRLTPSPLLSGVVRTPEGSPAPGVSVAAIQPDQWSMNYQIVNGRLRSYSSRDGVIVTDGEGRFKIPSPPEKALVIAVGDAGFARAEISEVRASKTVTLQAWGRIEGTLKIGGQPAVGKDLLFTPPISGVSMDFDNYKATTDEQGAFTMEKVPPGAGSIVRLIKTSPNSWSHSDGTAVTIKPGETTQVTLGDNGVVIAGHIRYAVPPTNTSALHVDGHLSSAAPMPPVPNFNTPQEQQAYYRSPAYRALMLNRKNYTTEMIAADTFTADNVAPGKYSLNIIVRTGTDWPPPTVAQGVIEITVPEDFNPATPIDVGEVLLKPPTRQ